MEHWQTDILVVGGGTGGTAAAIQAARRGHRVTLVSEFPWLGGMLTSAGVCVPDGHELDPWHTGLWGAFLQALRQRQMGGLAHSWVSLFAYEPAIGAAIFADWVQALPNLHWWQGGPPLAVTKQGDRLVSVTFAQATIQAKIILDGTELGDLLALGEVPHRWGWEYRDQWQEPSAPIAPNAITDRYAVQAPTWVFYLQDYGESGDRPLLSPPPHYDPQRYIGTWDRHGVTDFLSYGALPGGKMMINWPIQGNDYGEGGDRLIGTPAARQAFLREAYDHSWGYAYFLQEHLPPRYGIARGVFPHDLGGGGFALHPYYRESRRLVGLNTVTENDILPQAGGTVAPLHPHTIAIGNYPNDHHYPGYDYSLSPKAIPWGGRWTGTPFTIPYGALVPATMAGLLVCEKNIAVSHMANGSTRLQPLVLNLGQAAGMAAALCIERQCDPQDVPVALLQEALLTDRQAPAVLVPGYDLPPHHPQWLTMQRQWIAEPDRYSPQGLAGVAPLLPETPPQPPDYCGPLGGDFPQRFTLEHRGCTWQVITGDPAIWQQMQQLRGDQSLKLWGEWNPAGRWFQVRAIEFCPPK